MGTIRLHGRPGHSGRVSGTLRELRGGAIPGGTAGEPLGWEVVSLGPPTRSAATLAQGLVLGDGPAPADRSVPTVLGLPPDLFRDGDRVDLDGGAGWVDLADVERVDVVTAFLERADGEILLLRRSERVGSFRGHWATVSGFLEGPPPEAQARQEILEETGLEEGSLTLVRQGSLVLARAEKRIFAVHPFRFRTSSTSVRLDWEHTEFEWVDPSELRRRPTVPKLDQVWASVRDPT